MRLAIKLACIVCSCFIGGLNNSTETHVPEVASVSLCKLLDQPLSFSGKTVSVRADIQRFYHGILLSEPGCKNSILLEWPRKQESADSDMFQKDAEYQKFDRAIHNLKPDSMELKDRLTATVQGRFEYIYTLKNGKKTRVARGFGEELLSTSRLVLEKVSDVRVERVSH